MRNFCIVIGLLCAGLLCAQSPRREMRASWLATVWSIDWPKSAKITATGNAAQIQAQKNEMIRLLDAMKAANMNAVCFQVRSRCDVMYNSKYEPWSTDLVATRGMDPGYDPLQFVIEEGHKRGLEVHAWLNPYRFESVAGQWNGQPGDYNRTHPEWVMTYAPSTTYKSGYAILNPAHPGVIQRIKDIIGEIINGYDVDGILFDDYFYAYGGTPAGLDLKEQQLYKPEEMSVGDWRRSNVNRMVAAVYDTIQQVKPYVTFGVSPFGIWTTDTRVAEKEGIELPSVTGGNMYEEIYCDPLAWLKEGSIDYVSPQIYWTLNDRYRALCPWWSELANRYGKHFYSSHTLSGLSVNAVEELRKRGGTVKVGGEELDVNGISGIELLSLQENERGLQTRSVQFAPSEIGGQIGLNRSSDMNGAPGSIFYSSIHFLKTAFTDYLKNGPFSRKALAPAIHWKTAADPGCVTNIRLSEGCLQWDAVTGNYRYSIYAAPRGFTGKITDAEYLQGVSYENTFDLPLGTSWEEYTLAVAVLDRFGNEYAPAIMGESVQEPAVVQLIAPADGENVLIPFSFRWEEQPDIQYYLLEVAEDRNFERKVCSRELEDNSFFTTYLDELKEQTYYWRVRTRRNNAPDGISEIRTFTAGRFAIVSPVSGATDMTLTPEIKWLKVPDCHEYLVEISRYPDFAEKHLVLSEKVRENNWFSVPEKVLTGQTSYYVRITAEIKGVSVVTPAISFTTCEVIPAVPRILSPVDGEVISAPSLSVEWTEGVAGGYRVELSSDPGFPVRGDVKVKSTGAYVFAVTYEGVKPGTYYLRVRAEYAGNQWTDWSETVQFVYGEGDGLEQNDSEVRKAYIVVDKGNIPVLEYYTDGENTFSIELFAADGRIVYRSPVNRLCPGWNRMELPALMQSGPYIVRIHTDKGCMVLKFMNL